MLILTRRVGESLSIGDAVTVTVTAVNGTHVRVGIEAPPDVLILREKQTQPPDMRLCSYQQNAFWEAP